MEEKKGCRIMSNLIAFVNSFLSYFLLFAVCVVVVIVAVKLGITMRRKKNAKDALLESKEDASKESAAEV